MVGGTFSHFPGGVRACKDGLGHFFHVCPFDRGSKAIWAMAFQNGLPLREQDSP